MRWRFLRWVLLSLLFFVGAVYFWKLGERRTAEQQAVSDVLTTNRRLADEPTTFGRTSPFQLLSEPGVLGSLPNIVSGDTNRPPRFAHRLTNTTRTIGELARSEQAILLENALLDTAQPITLSIPEHLHAKTDPGSYIVQAKGPLDDAFSQQLQAAGATNSSDMPTTAYLVQISHAGAQAMTALPQTTTVLASEPSCKIQ